MKYISVDDFIKETIGKSYDVDKCYGVQCVDGIKEFTKLVYDKYDFNCGNGYANGLYLNYGKNGVEKYFDKISFKDIKRGDFVIWDKGSKEAQYSHVSMFLNKVDDYHINCYGQSQNGIKAFNKAIVHINGIIGGLRPKIYNQEEHVKPAIEYYPIPNMDGRDKYSIMDGLDAIGVDNSYKYRCEIARVNNIDNYSGKPKQNSYMLKLLMEGKLIKV